MKKILARIFCFIVMLIASLDGIGQDIHFSQFYAAPGYVNPALTGQYIGDWQAGNIYRNQWRSISDPFVSDIFFYDRHFYYYSQEISAAIILMHDESGPAALTGNKVYLSLAIPVKIDRSTISIGLQPGIVMKRFNGNDLTYPNQFDDKNSGYFNSDLPNNDPTVNGYNATNYFDLNAGILWKFNTPKYEPELGISLHHLNGPRESFFGGGERLSIRQSINGAIQISLKNNLYLKPGFWTTAQSKANMTVIGSNFGKRFYQKDMAVKEVFAGIYYRDGYNRNEDAIIPQIGILYNRWRIGISYDYNISGLQLATETRGAYELSVIYTAFSTLPKHSTIPCERY